MFKNENVLATFVVSNCKESQKDLLHFYNLVCFCINLIGVFKCQEQYSKSMLDLF